MASDERNIDFQEDRGPKHIVELCTQQKWLLQQKFKVTNWPAKSSNMNPIENLWAISKKSYKINMISHFVILMNYKIELKNKGMKVSFKKYTQIWLKIC